MRYILFELFLPGKRRESTDNFEILGETKSESVLIRVAYLMKIGHSEVVITRSKYKLEGDLMVEEAGQWVKRVDNNTGVDVLILDLFLWIVINVQLSFAYAGLWIGFRVEVLTFDCDSAGHREKFLESSSAASQNHLFIGSFCFMAFVACKFDFKLPVLYSWGLRLFSVKHGRSSNKALYLQEQILFYPWLK